MGKSSASNLIITLVTLFSLDSTRNLLISYLISFWNMLGVIIIVLLLIIIMVGLIFTTIESIFFNSKQ